MTSTKSRSATAVFPGASHTARLCRAFDWSATPLGPVEYWPVSLRTAAATAVASPFASALMWGPDFIQIYNDAAAAMMGSKHPRGLGAPARETWSEIWEFNGPILAAVRERGESFAFDDRPYIIDRHGYLEEAFFTVAYSPVPGDDGQPGGALLTILETTERLQAERDLRQANALIEGIARSTRDLIAAVDTEYRFLFFNDAYRDEFIRLWGLEPRLGMSLVDALEAWPDQQRSARDLWGRALAGETFEVTTAFGPSADERQHYDLSFSPIGRADGGLLGASHILRNVTEQVATREALQERERTARALALELASERRKLAAVIDTLPVGIGILDAGGRVVSMNRAGLSLHGYRSEAEMLEYRIQYRELFQLFDLDGRRLAYDEWPIDRALRGDYCSGAELRLLNTRHEHSRIVAFDVVPVPGDDGDVVLFVFVMQDRTEAHAMRHERERLLTAEKAAREAAERSSTVKSQFLSVISHELRTPLTAVLGYADLLQTDVVGPMNTRQKEYLGRVKVSALHLVTIIDEILTFSRAEAGRDEVRAASADAAAVTRNVVGMLSGEARARGLALTVHGIDDPVPVCTDAGKVSQILVNLVGNAIKYTDAGSVEVRLEAMDGWFEFRVADTGQGIPPDQLEEIFEPFVQVDQSNTRSRGGTGLGLAICRKLARMLGGDVHVASEAGRGSTFTCRLPRQLQQGDSRD